MTPAVGRENSGWMDTIERLDIPAHARLAHNGLQQKRLEADLCSIVPESCPPNNPTGLGTELN